ncbi:MAG: SIS domain-containing protein [Candidatus Limnocylindrales bacterium]
MTNDGAAPDRVGQFIDDILGSPAALARLLDASGAGGRSPLSGLRRPRIAFTGLGSSRYAALIVAAHLRSNGVTAWVEYPSATTGSAPATDLVLVAISASGRTPEVIDAVDAHHARSLVIGVTNDADSPLARAADIVVPLMAGKETAGIACRTFRATVAALAMMTGTAPDDLRVAVSDIAIRIESGDRWLSANVDALDRSPSIDVLADPSLVGLAEQAALMLREAPRLHAVAYETADWLHTGVYLALPGHRAMLYPGDLNDDDVVATIDRRGGQVVQVTPADGSPIVRALVESVVAELVAAELWRGADAYDKEP